MRFRGCIDTGQLQRAVRGLAQRSVRAWAVLALALGALGLWTPPAASAQAELQDARRAYLDADFENATRLFQEVLAKPSLTAEEAATAHRYLATLAVFSDDSEAIAFHAAVAVGLDPTITAAEGSPPSVETALAAAREEFGATPASLALASTEARAEEVVTVRAILRSAPEGLIHRVWLRCAPTGGAPAEAESELSEVSLSVTMPADGLPCRAGAVTASEATLFEARERFAPLAAVSGADDSPIRLPGSGSTTSASEPLWPWLVGGGVILAVGAATLAIVFSGVLDSPPNLQTTHVEGW